MNREQLTRNQLLIMLRKCYFFIGKEKMVLFLACEYIEGFLAKVYYCESRSLEKLISDISHLISLGRSLY